MALAEALMRKTIDYYLDPSLHQSAIAQIFQNYAVLMEEMGRKDEAETARMKARQLGKVDNRLGL